MHPPARLGLLLIAVAVLAAAVPATAAERDVVAAYSFDGGEAAGRFGAGRAVGRGHDALDVPAVGRSLRSRATVQVWLRPAAARRRAWSSVLAVGPRRRPALELRVRPAGGVALHTRTRRAARVASRRRVRGWTHVAGTYDGRTLCLYVDGRRVARRSARGPVAVGAGALRIGGSFLGVLDEVRLHSRALSGAQIRAGMRRPPSPDATGPVPVPATGGPPIQERAPGDPVPVYDAGNPPPTPALDQLSLRSSVSKDGITWTFAEPERVGQFITDDYYVVGPATVTAISPAPANGRNGSVRNLPPVDDVTGFDSRTDANRYDASLRSHPPVALAPGDSLVSSISVQIVGAHRRWLFDRATISPVESISVLTAVGAPQPPDAFRPSYVGRGAPIHLARKLRRDLLPRLAKVADTPSLAEITEHFRRPWVDSLMFNFDNPVAYMPDYSREIARAVGMAGLLLSLDLTAEQKEPLLVGLVQYGIDLAGLVHAGHPGWPAHGGHGSGRKLPIVLAGTLLDELGLKRPPGRFGEDMQTMMGPSWTGAGVVYAGHYGSTGSGHYGPYEHLQPSQWPSMLGEDYRRCCTSSAWIGEALTARLVPGVMSAWSHAPFFAYADRWMTQDDSQHRATIEAQTGKDYDGFPHRRAWDRFVTNMWAAYR